MWSKAAITSRDKYFPPAGPCAFCGSNDARHRTWDAIMDRHVAGESMKELARDYDLPVAAVRAVLRVRPYRRGGRL